MWVYFQGTQMLIYMSENSFPMNYVGAEHRDMFAHRFLAALENGERGFMFDETKPKFIMKLSGSTDDEDNEPQAEVGIE